jgi:hypothetical protein
MLLGNAILQSVTDGVTYFIWGALFELFTIQAMTGLFGDTPLVRDANELNFYAFMIHLLAIPFYLHGISSSYHNSILNALVVLYLIRLFYFGKKNADGAFPGWPVFGLLGHAHQKIAAYVERNGTEKKAFFFLFKVILPIATVAPMWTITLRTIELNPALLSIAATSFIFIYGYWRSMASAVEAVREVEIVDLAPASISAELIEARAKIIDLVDILKLFAGIVFAVLLVGAIVLNARDKFNFTYGYAAGYEDAKSGKKAAQETNWKLLQKCYGNDKYERSDPSCVEMPKVKD